MAAYKTRSAALDATATARTSLRMTESEWANIERLADAQGTGWLEWARQAVVEHPHLPKVQAVRKAIRLALTAQKSDDFDPTDEAYDHPFVNQSRFVNDEDLAPIKDGLREVWAVDCGTFVVRFGFNKLGDGSSDPLLIIENRMKDGMNMAFAASFGEIE